MIEGETISFEYRERQDRNKVDTKVKAQVSPPSS